MPKTAVSLFFCLLAALAQGRPEPSFSPRDVVRQARGVQRGASSVEPLEKDAGEFLIDTSRVVGPAFRAQYEPSVAFDGTNFLVVWQDYRNDPDTSDIYGARVTPQGLVLDPNGIAISTAADRQGYPAVTFDGTNFLVVWEDLRSDSSYDIYGARVTPQGLVLDPNGIAVSTAANWQGYPAASFDGMNFLVVWTDGRNGVDIYGARVTPQGLVLDPSGIAISTAANSQAGPAVSFDGTNFLVVWEDYRIPYFSDIYGARVSPAGTVLDPDGILISTVANSLKCPAVTFGGTNFLVVWDDLRSDSSYDIYGARVTPTGTVLDPSGIAISTTADLQSVPSVSFDGTNFLVVWQRGFFYDPDIYGARVSQAGTVLDPNGIAISTAAEGQRFPAVSFAGANYLVVWQDRRSGPSDLYGARVNQAGTVLDPDGILVSTATNSLRCPAITFGGTNFLVVWEDYCGNPDTSDIYGARVSQAGAVLDPTGIAISTAAYDQRFPAVGFDGTNFLVVWQDYRSGDYYSDIYGARVSQAGTVLDPSGIAISTAANSQVGPAVSFGGTNFLVVWQDNRPGRYHDIYGARVSPAGTALDPSGIPISTATNAQSSPAVSFDGTNFLVVWMDWRSRSYDIYGTRVSHTGTILDPAGVPISTTAADQQYPAVSFDGSNHLVVWQDSRSNSEDIYGARVAPAGILLDPDGIPVSTGAGSQQRPAVSFDGACYSVVWVDYRDNPDTSSLYGARVSPDGAVLGEFPVVAQEGNQHEPALCRGQGSETFLVYAGWAGDVQGKWYDAVRIWGKLGPFPGIQETPNVEVRTPNAGPTIVRGVLRLASASSSPGWLLDIAGRKVMELHPGANDVNRFATGVFFLRSAASGERSAVRKVVVTR